MLEKLNSLPPWLFKLGTIIAVGLTLITYVFCWPLKPLVWFWPIALLVITMAVLITIHDRQMLTLGLTLILLAGCYVLQGGSSGPEISQSATRVITRLFALIFLIGAIYFAAIYRKIKNKVNANINRVVNKGNSNEIQHPRVKICENSHGVKQYLEGKDRYLHTLLIGSTGTGKTSAVLAPMVWQDLMNLKRGNPLGITVVAPDAEFVHQVKDWCNNLCIPCTIIDLDDPNTCKFNPLEGDATIVAEIMRSVLRNVFGEQDAFFSQAQELHAKNTMLLLKRLMGNDLSLLDVYKALMDIEDVQNQVDRYEEHYGEDVVTIYFKKEAFGRNKDKLHQFAMGLRMQISDMLTNQTIYNVLVGRSDINLDQHMAEGGVLLFNTALGKMGHMSKVFGQFLIMHLQNAVFRRPGNEFTRIPQYLYIDELPVYFNPELQDLLNMGRKYRCACTFTIQGPAQLENGKQGKSIRKIIFNGCRNKIVIGIEDSEDAKLISELFGQKEENEVRKSRSRFEVFPHSYSETAKLVPRFPYTDVMELEEWHGLVKLTQNGHNQEPIEGIFEEPWVFQAKVAKEIERIPRHKILLPQQ